MKRFLSPLYLIIVCISWFCPISVFAQPGETDVVYIPEILIVADDDEASALESEGVVIWHRRQDMALACIPADKYESCRKRARGSQPGMSRRGLHRKAVPVMNVAKDYFNASWIHSGRDLPASYTGAGVVVGFCDTAFDPNHVNFLGADGKSRVKKLVHYVETSAQRTILSTPEEIAAWTTDNAGAYHATHVAGIMAGSYNANGYGGMAPEAEIVATTCSLYDVGILAACEEILEYARSVGKPAVINLSLASYNGPHDGTTLFNRYMSLIGEEAIVCMAAGNAGDDHNSYRITFTEDTPSWRTVLVGNDWVYFDMMGLTDAWSNDDRPISCRFMIFDTDTRKTVYESPLIDFADASEFVLSSDNDTEMAGYMTGDVWFSGRVNPLNGRWVTEVEFNTHSEAAAANSGGLWSRYRPALEFAGASGVHADITADGQYSTLEKFPGYPAPGADLSVSDIAAGDNVIVVGMYNNQDHIPTLGGTERVFNFEPFTVNEGSGYGTLIDGRVLPHTLAPGGGVVSSCNRYYNLAHPDFESRMHAVEVINGEKYYWASDGGTSMATPYVAGCVATWLEALPTITVDDVKEALEVTNFQDYPDPMNPRHGQGWLRPHDALKRLLLLSTGATPGAVADAEVRIVSLDNGIEVFNPTADTISISVHAASGATELLPVVSSESCVRISFDRIPPGVHIITVTSTARNPVVMKIRK